MRPGRCRSTTGQTKEKQIQVHPAPHVILTFLDLEASHGSIRPRPRHLLRCCPSHIPPPDRGNLHGLFACPRITKSLPAGIAPLSRLCPTQPSIAHPWQQVAQPRQAQPTLARGHPWERSAQARKPLLSYPVRVTVGGRQSIPNTATSTGMRARLILRLGGQEPHLRRQSSPCSRIAVVESPVSRMSERRSLATTASTEM